MSPRRNLRTALRILLWLGALLGAARATAAGPLALEVDVAIERGGTLALFFDHGTGFWPEHTAAATVPPGRVPQRVRLPLPDRPLHELRLDPATDDAEVLIAGLRLVDDRGAVLLRIDPRLLRPRHQIDSIRPEGEGVRIRPVPGANDPMLRLDSTALAARLHAASGRATVGPGAALALGALVAALLLAAGGAAAWALGGRGVWVGSATLFLAVLGPRLLWLHQFSRAVPFWDEWEGDALYLLIPFAGGFLDWGSLVMPQWEHRILLTRAITLAGTVLNGEWDPRVAMTAGAALWSALIALLGKALLATRTRAGVVAALLVATAGALPYDVTNLLWGGQTQMYGLAFLAVCTIAVAAAPRLTPWMGVAGAAGALLSLFTMGAGLVAPGCAAGICLVRAAFEPAQRRILGRLAAAFLAVALLGVLLHSPSRAHAPLYAETWAQFQRAWVGALSWPLPPHPLGALVLWVPWIVQGVSVLRRREATAAEWLSVGLGGWALVNAIALGYARQYEGPPFDPRFFTSLSLGAFASLLAGLNLAARATPGFGRGLAGVAAVTVAAGLLVAGARGVPLAQESGRQRADLEQRIRHYLATGDPAPALARPPHHDGATVLARLDSPLLQPVLPAAFRREAQRRDPATTAPPAAAGGLTTTVRTAMKLGVPLALLGLLGFGFWARRNWPGHSGVPWLPAWRRPGPDALAGALAVSVPVVWFLGYHFLGRGPLVDEAGHLAAIQHFLAGQAGWPVGMPMLPGYHFLVVSLAETGRSPDLLLLARLVTTTLWLLGLAAFAFAWRRLHGAPAGGMTLLLALFPLAQPFSAMAYTDLPALALVLAGVWAHLRGWRAFAALVFAGAVAMRQTSLVFVALLLAHEGLQPGTGPRTWLRRGAWLAGLGLAVAGAALAAGRLTLGEGHGNEFRFNPAGVHFAALLVLGFGLPLWLARAPAAARWLVGRCGERPLPCAAAGALAALAAGLLAWQFTNPHPWNRELFWPEHAFTLLRNWPLVWIDQHPWLRVLSGLNVVAMALAVGGFCARQPYRWQLALALGVGSLPAFANSLVEPRYFIPAAALALLFTRLSSGEWRRLAVWWAALAVVHAPFVAAGWSLW